MHNHSLTLRALRRTVVTLLALGGGGLLAQLPESPRGAATERGRQGPPHQSAPFTAQPELDVIAGRPTAHGAVLSLLSHRADVSAVLVLRLPRGDVRRQPLTLKQGEPQLHELERLPADSELVWELRRSSDERQVLAQGRLRTQRAAGQAFSFTVTADSHLDQHTNPAQYERTLAAVRTDAPDFHIDLGDTFMVDKRGREQSAAQYIQQRHYFGQLGVPLFLVLGNHDGEDRKLMRGGADNLALWANGMRKRYFPNPVPDGFYSGNSTPDPAAGLLQDYASWTWGDALFVLLNPYWHAPGGRQPERWQLSLGETQYRWLQQTLAASTARYKFVFVHQLVGGLDRQGRGGVEAIPFGEWGGHHADGSPGLAQQRPGWPHSIHQLLVRHGVTAVFHGHDHLFAEQRADGIVYQALPQPAHPGGPREPVGAEYGYLAGVMKPGSGYLRVRVGEEGVTSEFIGTQGAQARLLHRAVWTGGGS